MPNDMYLVHPEHPSQRTPKLCASATRHQALRWPTFRAANGLISERRAQFRVREDLNLQIHLEDGHSFVTWSESVAELLGGNRETFIAPDSVTVLNVDEILFLVLGPFSKLIAPVIDAAASVQIRIRDLNGR